MGGGGLAAADEQIINILQRIIYFEKLLSNYTINRTHETIYIQWK
jgi:hypothetical protein